MRWLRLLRLLPSAIGSILIILIATPMLALLDDRRRINRGPDMTDEAQPEENPPANTLASTALHAVWHAAAALDAAGVARTGAPQALPLSGAQEGELDLSDRIRLLAKDRDDRELARASAAAVVTQLRSDIADASALLAAAGVPMDELMIYQGVTELARELSVARMERDTSVTAGRAAAAQLEERVSQLSEASQRADTAEVNLSELHIKLRQMAEADSVAEALEIIAIYKRERDELTRALSETDELRAGFMRQRDEALAEAAAAKASAARFATTADPHEAILRAEIVVDVPSGTVVKSRRGKAFMLKTPRAAKAKPRASKKPAAKRTRAKAKARR